MKEFDSIERYTIECPICGEEITNATTSGHDHIDRYYLFLESEQHIARHDAWERFRWMMHVACRQSIQSVVDAAKDFYRTRT